ncbi:MAG: hypothetical protein COA78_06905 [Blastopirellula sp.]|nr:MAG: hypothetical protein COA78_06905 [Blastopirellula sp.]
MRKFLLLTLISLTMLLGGCAELWAAKQGAAAHAEQAADEALNTILFSLCGAMPVGAVNRRFKTEEEKEAYQEVCALL